MQLHVFTIARVCSLYGVKHAVISPGSRSAPLVYSFLNERGITCHSVPDERSAGFIALGLAQQTQIPTVLICTSGTATANYYPAVAEAYYQQVPLLILSADRPPELLDQQDGQMILQKGIFGNHILDSYELPCYREEQTDHQATADLVMEALTKTKSPSGFGPVHINVPLREPLYDRPVEISLTHIELKNSTGKQKTRISESEIEPMREAWTNSSRKLILVGQMTPSEEISALLQNLGQASDTVVLSDIVSNQNQSTSLPYFDALLQFGNPDELQHLQPDLILSFGGPFVSKALKLWLQKQKPVWHFRIQPNQKNINTYRNLTHTLRGEITPWLRTIRTFSAANKNTSLTFLQDWELQNTKAQEAVLKFHQQELWCEPTLVHEILKSLPENCQLQLGNSSAVRWVSWNPVQKKTIEVFANRGSSGIDGSISTAVGSALANPEKLIVLITGDISLLYDAHAFWMEKPPANLRILLLDNRGGNIFNWIEGPGKYPDQLPMFTTPHKMDFETFAKLWNLEYRRCTDYPSTKTGLSELLSPSNRPVLFHFVLDAPVNLAGIRQFKSIQF